ncbi:efflux RND transporter periplasmic adaptor subunit [Thalassotalea fusca]
MLSQKSRRRLPINYSLPISSVMLTMLLTACGQPDQQQQAMPAPAVSVYQVSSDEVGNYQEFVARTEASKEVALVARVEGELIQREFDEGSVVQQQQLLLKIDPSVYQASLDSAKADLSSREAAAKTAERDLKRGQDVFKDGYLSQADLDKLLSNEQQAQAAVKVAQAALEKAQLNLGYTEIKAPFSGQIGRVNYSVGNVVGPNSGPLATLTAIDPIYVNFQVKEADFISYQQKHTGITDPSQVPIDLKLLLPNNTEYGLNGRLDFADTKIEQGMGTIQMRAVFDNPNKLILPGLFVTLIIESKDKRELPLIPQAAVQENQQGKFVLVVADNKVVQRQVKLGRRINAMWVVESGVNVGEQIIIEGLQKVRAGGEVKPVVKNIDPVTGAISAPNT